MKFIDLFAGIGGFHYGLKRAWQTTYIRNDLSNSGGGNIRWRGNKQQTYDCVYSNEWDKKVGSINTKQCRKSTNNERTRNKSNFDRGDGKRGRQSSFCCVWSNEWDKYANSIYRKHFGECDIRDIRTVGADEIPDHDLLCAGFPCQSFSIAGKRGGFKDTRGTLFFEIARIARAKRTPYLLLENVKGLLFHDSGNTFATIISTLDELGYDLQWQVLNSKNFGVPQNRERVFIIGNLRGTARPKVFPIGEISQIPDKEKRGKQENEQGISSTIGSRYGALQSAGETYMIEDFYPDRVRTFDDSPTLRGDRQGLKVLTDMKIRRLTPIECERLQGFPDNWTEGISDTQRYKCLGNAVTVNVIEYLGRLL